MLHERLLKNSRFRDPRRRRRIERRNLSIAQHDAGAWGYVALDSQPEHSLLQLHARRIPQLNVYK
jgi:hypothetical protein